MRRERSCGIVVFRNVQAGERHYLLLQYPGGHWDFPKGHVERGESEETTARRELQEETGIGDVELINDFKRLIRYRFKSSGATPVSKQVTFFAGRVDDAKLTLSHEHRDYVWLPFDDAVQKVTFGNARGLLRAVERHAAQSEEQPEA